MTDVSIIIPAFNEEKNISLIHEKIVQALKNISYEIIFVDDGSSDSTQEEILKISKKDKNVKPIMFTKNYGQTSAWDAGIKAATGDYLVTMDCDLQNDPADVPKLLEEIKKSDYDAISGWRADRKDSFSKKFFSFFANRLRKNIIKESIHDSGCSLKIYKRECFDKIDLYGESHRYITSILALNGFKVGEMKVKHHSRKHGKTKYGMMRLMRGFLDLLFIAFMTKYASRPLHIFGGLGILVLSVGTLIGLYLTLLKIFMDVALANRPMLILAVLLIILGIQFIFFGILAEILMRIYYKTHDIRPYNKRK